MDKSLGRLLSKQFQISTSANHNGLDEYLTDKFNTSKENAKRNDSIKSSLFADNLMNTNPNQPHNNEATYTGSDVENDDNVKKARDDLNRITSRKTVPNPISITFSCTYNNSFSRSEIVLSIFSCMKSRRCFKIGRDVDLALRLDQED